jgi:tetratricopeptide (TPR) repeat protein
LAVLSLRTARLDEAERYAEEVVRVVETELGPVHPDRAKAIHTLGAVLVEQGRYAEAIGMHDAAREIYVALHGELHGSVGEIDLNLAVLASRMEQPEQAFEHLRRALPAIESARGRESPTYRHALSIRALLHQQLGNAEEGIADSLELIAILEATHGPEHRNVAIALINLVNMERDAERFEAAEAHLDRAMRILEATSGPEHPDMATALILEGTLQGARERQEAALPSYERALELRLANETPPELVAQTRMLVAGALADTGRIEEGIAQASAARDDFERAGPHFAAKLETVDDWLREHAKLVGRR